MPANSILKNVAAGVAGGLAGTFAMQYYWKTVTAVKGTDPRSLTAENAPDTLDDVSAVGQQHEEGESSTAAVGRKAHEELTGEEPTREEKATLSHTVHWLHGSTMGGLYGGLRGPTRGVDLAGGAVFGTAMWAIGDELMVPVLGLAKGPTAYPLEQHVHRLGAHVVYGCVTALTAQTILRPDSGSSLAGLGWKGAKAYAKWKTYQTAARGAWNAFQRLR